MSAYMQWLVKETPGNWWCDGGIVPEIQQALKEGAVGATTNPQQAKNGLLQNRANFEAQIQEVKKAGLKGDEKAYALYHIEATHVASLLRPIYDATQGEQGYMTVQLNPGDCGNYEKMLKTGLEVSTWAPNLSIKLPCTLSAMGVLEELSARGIHTTMTLGFTVAQGLAVAEAHKRGIARARAAGIRPGGCNMVVMVARVGEYMKDVFSDNGAKATAEDALWTGTAVCKRVYELYNELGYETSHLPAGFRAPCHLEPLAGMKNTNFCVTLPAARALEPMLQKPYRTHIDEPLPADVLERLLTVPEFRRCYEPEGLRPEEFITSGVFERSQGNFVEAGWNPLKNFEM